MSTYAGFWHCQLSARRGADGSGLRYLARCVARRCAHKSGRRRGALHLIQEHIEDSAKSLLAVNVERPSDGIFAGGEPTKGKGLRLKISSGTGIDARGGSGAP